MKRVVIAPFGVRMEEELKELLRVRAKKNGRSLNSEVNQILKEALKHEEKVA
ncbi:Arc family DNA-binding protein [Aeromonas sanarellii]|uniref:Arc family DNA-binding protein n=1 Tax=Aeromonas sanarellii TaxID=633415 RepID=UPI0038D208C4